MECFINYIGISACGGTTPPSGMYINQLPGITLKMLQGIASSDDETFVTMWNDIQARSLRKFKKDYLGKFKSKYVGFCCDDAACNPETIACDNILSFADAWMFCLGTELMIERLYTDRMNKYTTINKDEATELRDFYTVEYEKSINHAIKYLPKETIQKCFECRSSIDYVEVLP